MVRGIERFRDWFHGYEQQYAIIGGTACDLLMTDGYGGARGKTATKKKAAFMVLVRLMMSAGLAMEEM